MPGEFTYRQKVEDFEARLKLLPQVNFQTKHEFCAGLYARTITVPKGVAITGAIHASENFFFIRRGQIIVWIDDIAAIVFCAGAMVATQAGHKRVGYALSETIITTVHANPHELREPEELWEFYTVPDYESLDQTIMLQLEDE